MCIKEGQGEDDSKDFSSLQHYLQTILLFFIDGASKIDVEGFWNYFILYHKQTGHIAGFTTVFEAHKSAEKFRTKLAQIFVLPIHQGKGLGTVLYEEVYKYYLQNDKCFELIVEDANDNFQRVQDLVNSKYLLQYQAAFHEAIKKDSFITNVDQL